MKLWTKEISLDALVERFTVGDDRLFDMRLAHHDVRGSLAHGEMLRDQGLLNHEEWRLLREGLEQIADEIEEGSFLIEDEYEDVHSKIEALLTERVGEAGKKIHTARSRNDQVLVDMHLWAKEEIEGVRALVRTLFERLIQRAEEHMDDPMPGYTHQQIAMPSSFGLWFGAYAETLVDDLVMLNAAVRISDQNPLGSAAGYGSSFAIDRQKTTDLLGFRTLRYNAVGAGMSRGRLEWTMASALASLALTLSRLAGDIVLYSGGNFGFFKLPEAFTTGSSIMPHKKNPDIFELVRAHCNLVVSTPQTIVGLISNLPVGYHRDYQLLKEILFPAVRRINDSLLLTERGVDELAISTAWQEDERYLYLSTVERVNALVSGGLPFRDAYMRVAEEVESREYRAVDRPDYTHLGSIGMPAFDEIRRKFDVEYDRSLN